MNLWYNYENRNPEIVEKNVSKRDANYLYHEYLIAFALMTGKHRYGKDKLWLGTRKDESK